MMNGQSIRDLWHEYRHGPHLDEIERQQRLDDNIRETLLLINRLEAEIEELRQDARYWRLEAEGLEAEVEVFAAESERRFREILRLRRGGADEAAMEAEAEMKERQNDTPPNLRDAQFCSSCKHVSLYHSNLWFCNIHNQSFDGHEVDLMVCDDYEEEV